MITELLHKVSNSTMKSQQINPNIILLQFTIVNACIIATSSGRWILVDTGMENGADLIVQTAEKHFGTGAQPESIILTHGHFDHIGSVKQLLDKWQVPVYAHELEMPYLTGKQDYPQGDPSVGGGMVAQISPTFPHQAINLGNHIQPLPSGGTIPGLSEWRWIHTPGHTPGHISLFQDQDGTLIAGDAFSTVKQESMVSVLTQEEKISGPPAYLTTDWEAAEKSVNLLKELQPTLAIVSHGLPMQGQELAKHLELLTQHFQEIAVPKQGRFVE